MHFRTKVNLSRQNCIWIFQNLCMLCTMPDAFNPKGYSFFIKVKTIIWNWIMIRWVISSVYYCLLFYRWSSKIEYRSSYFSTAVRHNFFHNPNNWVQEQSFNQRDWSLRWFFAREWMNEITYQFPCLLH